MSEFKYACPVCGQHIKCDSAQAGSVMECPTCFQKITVPQAPAEGDQKFILTGTKVSDRKNPVPNGAGAVASAPEKKFPGAIMVIVILICIAAVAAFVYRGTIFKSKPAPPAEAVNVSNETPHPSPGNFPAEASSNATGNLALNKPSFAGSQESQNPPQNGNDGNLRTRWCASSGSVPQWWEVDLGTIAAITNTQIAWEHDSVYQYKIETSPDNTHWTAVVDHTRNSIPAQFSSDNFSASGRYVRIIITGLQPNSWASFYEFKVLGSGS